MSDPVLAEMNRSLDRVIALHAGEKSPETYRFVNTILQGIMSVATVRSRVGKIRLNDDSVSVEELRTPVDNAD